MGGGECLRKVECSIQSLVTGKKNSITFIKLRRDNGCVSMTRRTGQNLHTETDKLGKYIISSLAKWF